MIKKYIKKIFFWYPRNIFFMMKVLIINLFTEKKDGLADYKPVGDRLIILGNGPSLRDSIKKYQDILLDEDLMCVNYFANTDYYEQLKPRYYLLADPYFFNTEDTKVKLLLQNIKNKTDWNVIFFIPRQFQEYSTVNEVLKNSCIKVLFFSSLSVSYDYFSKTQLFNLLDRNKISPMAATCINTCIDLAIFYRFKEVYLIGVDANMQLDLHVDQNNNRTYIEDKHFYGIEKKYISDDNDVKSALNMQSPYAAYLIAYANMIEYYHFLKKYAERSGVRIYNSSEISYVDAFERRQLKRREGDYR